MSRALIQTPICFDSRGIGVPILSEGRFELSVRAISSMLDCEKSDRQYKVSFIFSGSKPKIDARLLLPKALIVALPRISPIAGFVPNNLLSTESESTCVNSGGKLDARIVEPTS